MTFIYFKAEQPYQKQCLGLLLFLVLLAAFDFIGLPLIFGSRNQMLLQLTNLSPDDPNSLGRVINNFAPMHAMKILIWCVPLFGICLFRLKDVGKKEKLFTKMILGAIIIYLAGAYLRNFAIHNLSIPFALFLLKNFSRRESAGSSPFQGSTTYMSRPGKVLRVASN